MTNIDPVSRKIKELRTLEAMGKIYCAKNHVSAEKDPMGVCSECRMAINETLERTAACPHGHEGNCQDCSTKCQRGESQKRIKEIMRYSAPRMILRHPIMTFDYLRKRFNG